MAVNYSSFSWMIRTVGAAFLVALAACQADKRPAPPVAPPAVQADPLRDSMETIAFLKSDSLCRYQPFRICELGVGAIVLGAPIRDAFIPNYPQEQITDSLDRKDGYVWVTRSFHFPKGRILVEGQYADEDRATDTLLSNSLINRIRVETPEFTTDAGVKVGMTLGELLRSYPKIAWVAVSIPGYEAIQVSSSEARQYQSFVFADKGYKLAKLAEKGTIPLDRLPAELKIQYVILL